MHIPQEDANVHRSLIKSLCTIDGGLRCVAFIARKCQATVCAKDVHNNGLYN